MLQPYTFYLVYGKTIKTVQQIISLFAILLLLLLFLLIVIYDYVGYAWRMLYMIVLGTYDETIMMDWHVGQ